MYQNYANPLVNHHLTDEDLEDTRRLVRPQLLAHLRERGMDFEWDYLDRTIETGVTEAAKAFLSI
jgi:hypothetical protein